MKRQKIRTVLAAGVAGEEVYVCGWVRTRRESKDVAFIALSDGSSQATLQLIIPRNSPCFALLPACTTGAALRTAGVLKESPASGQRVELEVRELQLLGESPAETYPLQKKGHSLEFLREVGHLRPRTNTYGAIFRIRHVLAAAVHEFFRERGFVWVHTPIITASDCEGAGELFSVTSLDIDAPPRQAGAVDYTKDFFGTRAFLTVSGQLEAEFMALALGDVYTFGPTFRAENSNTSRHLAEFWMIEPEMAFADLRDDMALAEDFFRFLCHAAVDRAHDELVFLEKQYKTITVEGLRALSQKAFAHMTYDDAVTELAGARQKFEFPVRWGLDLQSEHERYLCDTVFGGPVIVTDYPKEIKAFYMRLNDDGRTVAAMDVLVPRIGEIIGGSQREERLDLLQQRMQEAGVPAAHLGWYLDLRRYGSAPHAGFGMGFERMVQYITGMPNIRDVIPCPRAPQSIRL